MASARSPLEGILVVASEQVVAAPFYAYAEMRASASASWSRTISIIYFE
jgi:hypothetical protein